MSDLTLVIGNKNLSSWSLRPWILMKHFDIPFEEVKIRLDVPGYKEELRQHSPSGLVPCLKVSGREIWDSLAIAETLADWYPQKNLWPEDLVARARARCLAAEMHAGFSDLRNVWPMDICNEGKGMSCGPGVSINLKRIHQLWTDARAEFGDGGPFLFGEFSIADAMYAPVVSRIRTYGPVKLFDPLQDYMDAIWNHPAMVEWREGAAEEVRDGWYDF
ncbi:MAG: glutathione S-transferase family protein [Parvularculaceae bacterium]|nr:glutathione S-transferase family protein [Parvularculaceae bacterium]